jgi:peptide/nickel transport system permease protein
MVPTLLGVILITFFLFNVAGGSPAAAKLGKNVSPQALEEFDEQRGYNKPLFFGLWTETRAYEDSRFESHQGRWQRVEGVGYSREKGRIELERPGEYKIPLAFSLYADESFKWIIRYRLSPRGEAALELRSGDRTSARRRLVPGGWQEIEVAFETGGDAGKVDTLFDVENGTVQISSIRLRRRVAHFFDSQLWFYLKQLGRLDFGVSHTTNQKVSTMIMEGIVPSLALTVPIFVVGLVLAVSLSLVCAFFRNSLIDRSFVVVSVVLMSVNYLVWIVLGQYLFGYVTRWFPVWGFESFEYLILPCLIGTVHGLGASLRFYRTVMLDEMYQDYVRTAFAKGATRKRVLFRHVLKNAMIPILTSVIITIPYLYTGSLLLETFFGIPGLGRMSINALNNSDFDVIKAVVLIGAVMYVFANLVTDICYAAVDPRVKLK